MHFSLISLLKLPHCTDDNLILHEFTCNLYSNRKSFTFLNGSSDFVSVESGVIILGLIFLNEPHWNMTRGKLKDILIGSERKLVDGMFSLPMIRCGERHGRRNQQVNLTSLPLFMELLCQSIPLLQQHHHLQRTVANIIHLELFSFQIRLWVMDL